MQVRKVNFSAYDVAETFYLSCQALSIFVQVKTKPLLPLGFNQWWHNAPTTTRYVIIVSVTVGAFAVIFLSCFFVLRLSGSGDKDSFLSTNKTVSTADNITLSDSQPGGIYVPCEGELDDVFGIKFSSEGYTLVELVDEQPCTSSPDSKRSNVNGNGSHKNLMEELLESKGRIPSTIKREKLKKMFITQL